MATVYTKQYVVSEQDAMPILRAQIKGKLLIYHLVPILLLVWMLNGEGAPAKDILLVGAASSVFSAFLFFRSYHGTVRQQREGMAQGGFFSVPIRHEISDEFFGTYMPDGTFSKNPLAGYFVKVEKRPTFYHLLTGTKGHLFIPLDAFETDAERQQFEALLAGKGVPIKQKS